MFREHQKSSKLARNVPNVSKKSSEPPPVRSKVVDSVASRVVKRGRGRVGVCSLQHMVATNETGADVKIGAGPGTQGISDVVIPQDSTSILVAPVEPQPPPLTQASSGAEAAVSVLLTPRRSGQDTFIAGSDNRNVDSSFQEAQPATDMDLDQRYRELVAAFPYPMYDRPAEFGKFYDICVQLVKVIGENSTRPRARKNALVAFLLLPGCYCFANMRKKELVGGDKLIDDVYRQPDANSKAKYIVDRATEWKSYPVRQWEYDQQLGERRAQSLVKRAHRLARNGRISTAMSVVEQLELALDSPDEPDSPPLDYEETRRLVLDLHPRGDLSEGGRDTLPCFNSPDFFLPDRSEPASIDIDIADVRKAINYANRSSGRGVSGWTFALVKQLMNYGTEQQQERLLQALKQWAERLFRLRTEPWEQSIMTMSRIILIAKPDGGHRPIGIPETWLRIFLKAIAYSVRPEVADKLGPYQVAVGIQNGCEIVGNMCDLHYHRLDNSDGHGILKIDCRNAFNTINRLSMFQGLQQYCPRLLPVYRFLYGRPSELRDSKTSEVLTFSSTGCRQGDPMSPIFFACGLQTTLLNLFSRVNQIEARRLAAASVMGSSMESGAPQQSVFAYADDINIVGSVSSLLALVPELQSEELLGRTSMEWNPCKTLLITRHGIAQDDARLVASGLRHVVQSAEVLGRLVGSEDAQQGFVLEKAKTMMPPERALSRLHKHVATSLLIKCVNARANFLSGAMPPCVTEAGLRQFDAAIDRAFDTLHDVEGSRYKDIRDLPQRLGGLGIPRYAGNWSHLRAMTIIGRTCEFIKIHDLRHLSDASDAPIWRTLQIDDNVSLPQPVRVLNEPLQPLAKLWKDALESSYVARHQMLVTPSLAGQPSASAASSIGGRHTATYTSAAWFCSLSYRGSARWMSATPLAYTAANSWTHMNKAFSAAVQLRVLAPVMTAQCSVRCTCRGALSEVGESSVMLLHCLRCDRNGPPDRRFVDNSLEEENSALVSQALTPSLGELQVGRTTPTRMSENNRRHHAIRDLLADFLRRAGFRVDVEVGVGDGVRRGRMDLIVHAEQDGIPTSFYVDVTVIDPTRAAVMERGGRNENVWENKASIFREDKKIRDYEAILSRAEMRNFVPFVLEASGRWGPRAIAFINNRCLRLTANMKSRIYHDVSIVVANHVGLMVDSNRDRMVEVNETC